MWSTFVSAFRPAFTASRFTPDNSIIVTRIQVQLPVAPSGCTTNAVLTLTDGVLPYTLTVTAAANDSGPLSLSYNAGVPLTISVSTPANCNGIPPALANVVVQYKAQ